MVLKLIILNLVFSLQLQINGKQIASSVNKIQDDKRPTDSENIKIEITKHNVSGQATINTSNTQSVKNTNTFCQSFQSCFECVNNVIHPCYWCHNYGCTDKANNLCPETVAKMNTTNMNANFLCPYIKHDGAILVHAGMRTNLKVKLHAPDPVIYDKEIICQIHFKQSLTHLKGLIMNDIIYCYPVILETADYGKTNTGYLKIIWGGVEPISNGIPVLVYNCENLADDCSDCRLIAGEYGCGWCDKIKRCVIADKCGNSLIKWSLTHLDCDAYDRQLLYV